MRRSVGTVGGLRRSPLAREVLLGLVGGGALAAGAAHAQLEEVIVTAERREMSLQDTPISVVAFTGEGLEFKGVRDMMELANATPNLDIKGSRGTGNTSPNYQIRGIGGGGGATGERGVGFYIDNVFMPRTTGPVMRVLDVERIEVLRGPQGTLFGRNSTGGAIRVFSRQPHAEREGYLRVTGGNFDHFDITGMINVPLSDEVFFRAQAARLRQDGYVRRGPQNLGDSEDTILRLQLAWEPSDKVTARFGVLHTDSESEGSPTDMVRFNMEPACPFDAANPYICWEGNYADWMSDFLEQFGQERLRHDDPRLLLDDFTMPDFCFLDGPDPDWDDLCRQWNKNDYLQVDANITWRIGDRVTMISTTGISEFSSDGVSDWQLLGMEHRREQVESEVFYQEFQFNLDLLDGGLSFVTGLNYFREDSESPRNALLTAYGSSTFNPITGGNPNGNQWGCPGTDPFCAEPRLRVSGDNETRQTAEAYGVFANATWHATDRLNVTLGLRFSHDSKDFTSTEYASDLFIPEDGVSTTVRGDDSWTEVDRRATIDYRITDDVMAYVTHSKAFRAGSFTAPAAQCVEQVTPCPYHVRPPAAAIPPERLINNEAGIRTEWLDGRLRFNATYFDMDFTNRQGASAVPDDAAPTGFVIQLVNQGDVDLDGMELEASFALTERLMLDASAGWVDYRMHDPCVNNGFFLFPPPVDRSVTWGGRYNVPIAGGGSLSIGLSYSRIGPQETHSGGMTEEQAAALNCPSATPTWFRDSRYRLDGYALLNAVVRYTSRDGRWTASLYGNNLTDEIYANNAQSFGRGYWTAGGPTIGINSVMRSAVAEY
ncbi:MAG: TonB-dependent receptor, partial [Gammaproteobacteria bacterium]